MALEYNHLLVGYSAIVRKKSHRIDGSTDTVGRTVGISIRVDAGWTDGFRCLANQANSLSFPSPPSSQLAHSCTYGLSCGKGQKEN